MNAPLYERSGCPFCGVKRTDSLGGTRYYETAEANRDFPDFEGQLYACHPCGIAYSSHGIRLEAFPHFYQKSFRDLSSFNESILQKLRKGYLKAILKNFGRPASFSRFLNALSFNILQVPPVLRRPQGLRLLDVGCGFGEFLETYKRLGNDVVGTEVIPSLVDLVRSRGLECHLGAVEDLSFHGKRFDVVILRAVFYRTENPARTLKHVKDLLAPGGEIAFIDPCPLPQGVHYFLKKQFPQGHFYIMDPERYLAMLCKTFGFTRQYDKQIYGRPASALKTVGTLENLTGAFELLYGNVFKSRPYVLSYNLSAEAN